MLIIIIIIIIIKKLQSPKQANALCVTS